MKIATHNSVTGETGSFFSKIITPFAKCQSKNLVEQYNSGCRLFDIRAIKHKDNIYGAHGLWRTKKPLEEILLNLYLEYTADNYIGRVYIMITYEKELKSEEEKQEFIKYCNSLQKRMPHFVFGSFNMQNSKGEWIKLKQGSFIPKNKQGFKVLNKKCWQSYLPIPYLWKLVYFNKPKFNNDYYLFVDFL